jgi:hypothetical protein
MSTVAAQIEKLKREKAQLMLRMNLSTSEEIRSLTTASASTSAPVPSEPPLRSEPLPISNRPSRQDVTPASGGASPTTSPPMSPPTSPPMSPSRRTCDFPYAIQLLLKKRVNVFDSSYEYERQLAIEEGREPPPEGSPIDLSAQERQSVVMPPPGASPTNASATDSSHSHSSLGSVGSDSTSVDASRPATVIYSTAMSPAPSPCVSGTLVLGTSTSSVSALVANGKAPTHAQHFEMAVRSCGDKLCRAGWECWKTDASCGGYFFEQPSTSGTGPGPQVFHHREPLTRTEANIGWFVVCVSFLRRCMPKSEGPCASSDEFLRAIDLYAQSGLQAHACSIPLTIVRSSPVPEDDCARRFVQGLPLEALLGAPEPQAVPRTDRTSRGVLIAACLHAGCARIDELEARDQHVRRPAIPVMLQPPRVEHATTYVPDLDAGVRKRSGSAVAAVAAVASPRDLSAPRSPPATSPPMSPKATPRSEQPDRRLSRSTSRSSNTPGGSVLRKLGTMLGASSSSSAAAGRASVDGSKAES